MDFPALAGNGRLKQQLSQREEGRGLSHAYLIAGPKGSGRHTLATELSAAMVCTAPAGQRPCHRCPPCKKVLAGVHPDVNMISGGDKPIAVDQVRSLRSDAYVRPNEGQRKVYVLEGEQEGDSMLVLGGTHPNEPSGLVAAVLLIENAQPEAGTLYVIPRTNNSAFTCTDPQEGAPMRFTIETPNGERWFRFGSRATNPIHQWPDPEIYVHASSGQRLSGSETRNINRSYPGRTDGTFTEKMSYGVTQLIEQEGIDITVDLHEASPEYPTINTIVAHQDALSLGSQALINMQLEGMSIGLEPSPENLHGLTHRELGDYTDTLALLMETSNPSQGRLRGKTDENLVVTGQDKYYLKAAGYGRLYDFGYDADGAPISERVARHVTGVAQFAVAFNELGLGNLVINGIPSYVDMAADIGQFLAPD